LYDDQQFSDTELDLIHTPALQRLYDLHQLGLTDRVFVDASHSRLHHVIGVVEQADKIMLAVIGNLEKDGSTVLKYGKGKNIGLITKRALAEHIRRRRPAIRLMGLLHDLTHAPFGHTLEDEIELVDQKHDEPDRQADAFYRLLLQYFGWISRNYDEGAWGVSSRKCPVEDLENFDEASATPVLEWYLDAPDLHVPPTGSHFTDPIAKEWSRLLVANRERRSHRRVTPHSLRGFARDLAFSMRALLFLDIAHKPKTARNEHVPKAAYAFDRLLSKMLSDAGAPLTESDQFVPLRDVFLLDIIGNTICADLLDYARRDAVNAGLRLDFDPARIVANMTIVSHHENTKSVGDAQNATDHPFKGDALRTAVSVFSHKLRTDAPGELIHLLQVRFYVYERMLYHPTKCVAGAMLGAAIQWIGWRRMPWHLHYVGDAIFLHQTAEAARVVRDLLSELKGSYTREVSDRLKTSLEPFATGVAAAARQLLTDRLGQTKKDLVEFLEVARRLNDFESSAAGLLSILQRRHAANELDDNTRLDARWKDLLTKQLNTDIADVDPVRVEQLLAPLAPTVAVIRDDIKAGLRLLDRLIARRYHKVVFRALPDDEGARTAGLHDITANEIADKFRQAAFRRVAEREIENTADLPRGSVVIHCPRAEGPTKIANILMTDGSSPKKLPPLSKIRDLNPIFAAHQDAVQSQQDMYKSTWRLSVSVAPPHEYKWAALQDVIGRVLFQLLEGVGEGVYPNDEFMKTELSIADARVESATDDQFEGRRDLAVRRLMAALTNVPGLERVLSRAQSGRDEDALRELTTLLTTRDAYLQGTTTNGDSVDKLLWASPDEAFRFIQRTVSVTGWQKRKLESLRQIMTEVAALNTRQQRYFAVRVPELPDYQLHSANRLSVQQQDAFLKSVQSRLAEAKSLDGTEST
jgi:HD superfamily phosphohydrolase